MSYNPPGGGWSPRPQDPADGADQASQWSAPSNPPPSADPTSSSSTPGWPSWAQHQGGTGSGSPGYGIGAPAPPPPPPGYGAGYQGGYGTPQYGYGVGYGYTAPKTDGTAIACLVLSIVSFVVCFGIPAIVALALIPSSRRNIAAANGALEGSGMLTAAKWISIANLSIVALGFIAIVIAAIASSNSNSSSMSGHLALLLLR